MKFLFATALMVGLSGSSVLALSPEEAAELFEKVRSQMPCLENAETSAAAYNLLPTGQGEVGEGYTSFEYGDRSGSSYLVGSYEIGNGRMQSALSVSVYGAGDKFGPDLTNAFADLWDLPAPTPLRRNSDAVQFEWQIAFPNADMQVIVMHVLANDLTQIYGRTLNSSEAQLRACKSP
ncbi:hypothetical protein QTO30_10085 [Yoonia sp. GPGPB17]|uniref:hypothetical protein n=1 Tax=Yoonia sp. GPGPB17 TaxID=3026147 RepID=UPI0030C2D926